MTYHFLLKRFYYRMKVYFLFDYKNFHKHPFEVVALQENYIHQQEHENYKKDYGVSLNFVQVH